MIIWLTCENMAQNAANHPEFSLADLYPLGLLVDAARVEQKGELTGSCAVRQCGNRPKRTGGDGSDVGVFKSVLAENVIGRIVGEHVGYCPEYDELDETQLESGDWVLCLCKNNALNSIQHRVRRQTNKSSYGGEDMNWEG